MVPEDGRTGARGVTRALGLALCVIGVVVNEWTLERAVVPDGRLESTVLSASIVALQLIAVGSGVLLLRGRVATAARALGVGAMTSAVFLWLALSVEPTGTAARFRFLGRYEPDTFLALLVATYAAGVGLYVLWVVGDWRRRSATAALSAASLAVVLSLLEAPAFFGWVDYRGFLAARMVGGIGPTNRVFAGAPYFHRPPYDTLQDAQPGDGAFLAGIPDAPLYPAEYLYDRNGFRNASDPNEADVVLVGDSFIEGYKVTQSEIVSVHLERLLGAPVYNLGQADFGPVQELAALREVGLAVAPSVVAWFFFEGNDLFDRPSTEFEWPPPTRFSDRSLVLNVAGTVATISPKRAQPVHELFATMTVAEDFPADRRDFLFEMSRPFQPDESSLARVAYLLELLDEAATLTRSAGADFVLLFVPIKARVYQPLGRLPEGLQGDLDRSDLPARLQGWAAEAGVAYVDLTPALTGAAMRGEEVYYPDDAHWTGTGHRVVAESLAALLAEGAVGGAEGSPSR